MVVRRVCAVCAPIFVVGLMGCDPRPEKGAGAEARLKAESPDKGGSSGKTSAVVGAEAGPPSSSQVPLDPALIPKFAHELPIPRVFAPTTISQHGRIVRNDYTVSVAETTVQMLPPPLPTTTVFAYGGQVKIPGSSRTEFARAVPGPVFENTRGIPSLVRWRNEILQPHFLPVDPTLHWANPLTMEAPTPPFLAFPPGYASAQYPVPHVTHTHGLVVNSENDGTAEQWFTSFDQRGPTFFTRDYLLPNQQLPTHLFYHEHAMGISRLGFQAGLVGTAYFIRDPNNPLDRPDSPLPKGRYEIPLTFFNRGFFTDGEIAYPRTGLVPSTNPYWTIFTGANTAVVNGKVWPNLNVERRQYRFRMLAADNFNDTYSFAFSNGMPFTIIGSDGGYLPAPRTVTTFSIGITERADVLVDFSALAPGTQVVLLDTDSDPDTLGTLMRFTVLDTPPVPPPTLSPSLFPQRPTLVPNAPKRTKTMQITSNADGSLQVLLDGMQFPSPITEYPLVGSTEQWDLVQLAGLDHQIHLHLIEFQVLERQPIDADSYQTKWLLTNGVRPISRPIVIDPTPFFTGPPEPPHPHETGWKDTVRTPGNYITRIIARWAPQDIASGGVSPGENRFPIDPTTGPGYMWHCHVVAHEDHDMMRRMPLVNAWVPGTSYGLGSDQVGTVVAYQDVDYRVRVPHVSRAKEPPNTRFDLWARVNNNDGAWAPQIIYAVDDRVLFNGQLYAALSVHQAQNGQTPADTPSLWHPLPTTACGQLAEFCHGEGNPTASDCHVLGHVGDESACVAQIGACLPVCLEHVHAAPCSGLCNNPVSFAVPDFQVFQSGPLGTDAACYETTSQLLSGHCLGFAIGQSLTVNGNAMPCNHGDWTYPLPPQRNHGYCIQTTASHQPWARFAAW